MPGRDATDVDGLLGRDGELARLAALCDRARAGQGGAVLIAGVPGVGKTALLRAADASGLRVLDVTGAESEIDLPFAGLAVLLQALLGYDVALAPPQRAALAGALALGQPAATDPVHVLQAASALLAAAAVDSPALLLRVDDVQWLDPSSQQAVAFIARRAARIGVGVIATWSLRGAPLTPWADVELLELEEL